MHLYFSPPTCPCTMEDAVFVSVVLVRRALQHPRFTSPVGEESLFGAKAFALRKRCLFWGGFGQHPVTKAHHVAARDKGGTPSATLLIALTKYLKEVDVMSSYSSRIQPSEGSMASGTLLASEIACTVEKQGQGMGHAGIQLSLLGA